MATTRKRDFKTTTNAATGVTSTRHTDKTESGAICAAMNVDTLKIVFNEDIYRFDETLVQNVKQKSNTMIVSAQCDDFSCLKNNKDKETAIQSLDTTRDMIFPIIDRIKETKASTVLLENVRNFASSIECALFMSRLEELGYTVKKAILNAVHFNGYTNRVRCFVWASTLDDTYEFPQEQANSIHLWNDIIEPNMHMLRDVTHTKTVAKAIETKRIRTIEVGAKTGCTLTKSQARQVKDSCYIHINGQYFLPNNDMMKMMMGISNDFDLSFLTDEIGTEIVGQSIEVPLHAAIAKKIKTQITGYTSNLSSPIDTCAKRVIEPSKASITPRKTEVFPAGLQLSLF